MVKRFVLLLLLTLSASTSYAQSTAIKQLYRTIKDSYETKADSTTDAFIESFMIKEKGYFNGMYNHYVDNAYWQQAPSIDVVICNYQRHKNIDRNLANKYLNYIKLWYKNKANNYYRDAAPAASSTTPNTSTGYKMFENGYTDDMCWITLELLRIAEATGSSSYAIIARQVFDNYIIKRRHLTEDSTAIWLPWNTDAGSGPNACTQSPATLIAAKLYQRYGTAKYLDYAKKLYKYTANNIVESDGRIGEPPLTYTQGTFAEACRILYHVTDENTTIKNKYKSQAYKFIYYAFTSDRCTNGQNILRDEGSDGNQSIFKAVLIPYAVNYVLDETMTSTNRKTICEFIQKNTKTLWPKLNFDRYPIVFYNTDWTKSYTGADSNASMGAACSGASLIENTARMHRAIIDRYELGALYAQCEQYVVDPEYESETVYTEFTAAMQAAKEIIDNPNGYMSYQFRQAIENLEAAYQALQDFTTDIKQIAGGQQYEENDIFDLSGRKVVNKNLPRGIYIIGGRKVMIK